MLCNVMKPILISKNQEEQFLTHVYHNLKWEYCKDVWLHISPSLYLQPNFYFQIDQNFTQIYSEEQCGSLCKEFSTIARSFLVQAKNCGRQIAEEYAETLSAEIDHADSELFQVSKIFISTAYLICKALWECLYTCSWSFT